ncbi:protein DBF4 homolog A isoform X2 [Neoarius graeffei]|uniref:protein DBF4 homolog A isoform X2 n=1 Tax=Neoarius graeffei TaxID=443677 RepID=UPI00298BEA0C|nr:protein DBF4 homolog A isoform X2 [Neoarius graeffei]
MLLFVCFATRENKQTVFASSLKADFMVTGAKELLATPKLMKHQSLSRATEFKDPKLDNDEHRKAASIRKQHSACDPVQKKPLAGRIFYLDIPCNERNQALETDIKILGGTVEKFFSKEIRYLVSSKPEARHVQRLVQDSPVPSPDSGLSSPHPGSRRDSHSHRGSSQGPADTVVVSRGKSLVEKVVKQERIQMNRILSSALEWGVKILHVDDVISYIDKKKSTIAQVRAATQSVKKAAKPEPTDGTASQKSKPGRINRPFVKVEDSSRHYRPFYLPMANMPVCNFRSAAPCSPFLEKDKADAGKQKKVHGSRGDQREKSRKDRHRGHEGKGRRKGGYCECCLVKYDNLKAHLQSEQHQAFSKSEEYLVVDRVISGLTCDFAHISPQIKRVKCSVTSPLIIPGPAVRKDGEPGVEEEDVTDETPLWGSHNTPQLVRKRSREFSQSPKGDSAGQSDTFQKSRSKRGSFEWDSSSNAALQKALGTSLSNTRQDCLSECLGRTRTLLHACLERRTSQSTLHARLSDPTGFGTTRSLFGAGTSRVASEPSVMSDFQTAPKLRLDGTECTTEGGFCKSGKAPEDTHRELVTEEMPSFNTDILPGVLKRKVRALRRRRSTPSEPLRGLSVEPQTLQCLGNVSESRRLSASTLDLWELFQSSDDMEEDFKGFYNW